MTRYLAALLLCATAARAERPPASVTEWGLLAAAEASLAVDLMQTVDIQHHQSYRTSNYMGTTLWEPLGEINPILGSHPSDAKIAIYFVGAATATAASWYFLPRPWRDVAPVAVLALEVVTIGRNAAHGIAVIRF